MATGLRVFDLICARLSDLAGEAIIGGARFHLWAAVISAGWSPSTNGEPLRAAMALGSAESMLLDSWKEKLGEKAWQGFLREVRQMDPSRDTPEEVFTRLGEA